MTTLTRGQFAPLLLRSLPVLRSTIAHCARQRHVFLRNDLRRGRADYFADLSVIDAFMSQMDHLAAEFDGLLSQAQKKPWWWPWTEESKEIEQHAALLEERHRSHLKEFLVNLYPELQGSGQK